MKDKLIKVYKMILSYCGMVSDDDGYVSTKIGDRTEPCIIDDHRLVLPTEYHLSGKGAENNIIFHPLTECVTRSDSPVLTKLKYALNVKLNYVTTVVMLRLLDLVASSEDHHKLNPEQSELLLSIKDCDEKTVKSFTTIAINGLKTKPDSKFVNIYIKRGGKYKDRSYYRVAVTSFSLYKEMLKEMEDKGDSKLRNKDRESIVKLYEFMFPDLGEPEAYNKGVSSDIAPSLESLLQGSNLVATRLNILIDLYSEFFDDVEQLKFNDDWVVEFEDIAGLQSAKRSVPVQAGNEGMAALTEAANEAQKQPTVTNQPFAQPQTPVLQTPSPVNTFNRNFQPAPERLQTPPVEVRQAPMQGSGPKTIDFKSVLASQQNQQSRPMYPQAPQQPMGYPTPYNPQPMYQQPQQQQPYYPGNYANVQL